MKALFITFFFISSAIAQSNYDHAFHLRHRYNGTEKSLKGRDLSEAQRMQDPREGLKSQDAPKPHKRQKLKPNQEPEL